MDARHFSGIFREQVEKYGDRVAMRFKEEDVWKDISWRSFGERVDATARALVEAGIGEQETVGIFSQNCPEWTIADIGSLCARAVPVPIYPTNTAKQAEYIVNDAEIQVLFVGGREQYDKAMTFFGPNRFLKKIVVFRSDAARDAGDGVVSFAEFLEQGRRSGAEGEVRQRMARANPDDLLTLVYTSGTTGEPKGVMLTTANILFQKEAHDRRLPDPNENDVSLCFLPLSHVFERAWTYYVISKGMVNTYLDDPSKIVEAIREVRPTIMCAVPRFYEKIYAAVNQRLESASPYKRRMFAWALRVGAEYGDRKKDKRPIPPALRLKHAAADALVLKKIREIVGGRVRFFPCAGAPLSEEIEAFFYAAGLFVCYGYGLTETCATVSCHEPHFFRFGAVGKPLPGVEVKIDEASSEILVRGGNVMKGYYKKPRATAEVFTEDGWFRTGDAGRFEDNGELRITDRIKDLMKTSGGKYIAPQAAETLLGADPYIEQAAIIGDQRKFVTALVVPCFEALEAYAREHGIAAASRDELLGKPEIVAFYGKRIDAATAEFARFEKIKRFTLMPREFTVDEGEITPTLKIRRKVVADKYKDLIDRMYQE